MMKVALRTFERKTTEMEYYSHHILSRTHITHIFVMAGVDLCHLAEVVFGRFPVKLLPPSILCS